MPSLLELKFKGGEPFVSDSVKEWLASVGQSQGAAGQSVGGDWQEKRKEAFQLAKEGGIAVALSMLNDGLVSAVEPRDKVLLAIAIGRSAAGKSSRCDGW